METPQSSQRPVAGLSQRRREPQKRRCVLSVLFKRVSVNRVLQLFRLPVLSNGSLVVPLVDLKLQKIDKKHNNIKI